MKKYFIALIVFAAAGVSFAAVLQERNIINANNNDFSLQNNGQKLDFEIPTGVMGADVALRVSFNPLVSSYNMEKSVLAESLNGLSWDKKYFADQIYELSVFDGSGYVSGRFNTEYKLNIHYNDADNDGIVDGSDPVIFEENLHAYYLNSANQWVLLPRQTKYPAENYISVLVEQPCCAALIGQVGYSDSPYSVRIYPNPVKLSGSGSQSSSKVTIASLPLNAKIRIYTVSGDLVRELAETDTDGIVEWNLKNSSGKDVASGVYIVLVKSGGKTKTYKIAVER